MHWPLLYPILLQSIDPANDLIDSINRALTNLPAVLDGSFAFALLFLSIYIGFTSLLPLPYPPIALQGIVGLSVFVVLGIVGQVIFTQGNLRPDFLPGLIRDLLLLGFSILYARYSLLGLIVLLLYSAIWALPDAISRCAGVCPFAQIEQLIPW